MVFSRLAEEKDFENYPIQYDHFRYMDDSIKKLIENKKFSEALVLFGKETGRGVNWAKKYCEEYRLFVQAKKDFEAGKQIFVSYQTR